MVEHPQQPVVDGDMPEGSRVHSGEQGLPIVPVEPILPAAPAASVLQAAPGRPKFRDRVRVQESGLSPAVSPALRGQAIQEQSQGRRIGGLIALVVGVVLLTYAVTRLTTPTSSGPAAPRPLWLSRRPRRRRSRRSPALP